VVRKIEVRGAREHNLAAVDLVLDPDQLTVFVGRSGSGKSSLAFDTLHAEGWRRYLQALSHQVRQLADTLPRPAVDLVSGLPPTVALAQRGAPASSRSTVGSVTELERGLRVLFGRAGALHCPSTGEEVRVDTHDSIVARLLALPAGSRLLIEAPVRHRGGGELEEIARAGFSRVRLGDQVVQLDEVDPRALKDGVELRVVVDRIRLAADRQDRLYDAVRTAANVGRGVMVAVADEVVLRFVDRPYSFAADQDLLPLGPELFRPVGPPACAACEGSGEREGLTCEDCAGSGLGPVARAARWDGHGYVELHTAPLDVLASALEAGVRTPISTPLLAELTVRARALCGLGLGHLSLSRTTSTLSTGELQRVRLARQVASELSGVLVILDEPTTGLDDAAVQGVISLLRALQAQGNGVLVVEHHPAVIQAADRVVEFGPGAGAAGGRVVFDGTPGELRVADTLTGRWLRGEHRLQRPPAGRGRRWVLHTAGGEVELQGHALNALVGPSGSGKTRLLARLSEAAHGVALGEARGLPLEGAAGLRRVLEVEAGGVARSKRSMPATYVSLWSSLRELLASTTEAQVRGLNASSFSLNVRGGRCEACAGLGVTTVSLQFLPPVDVRCELCEGRRFSRDVLEVRWRGLDAGAVLELTADEARPVLAGHPRLDEALRALQEVGLGYVRLGQPAHTLSGGEAKRLKLAKELERAFRQGAEDTLVLLDDPTAGLHPEDVAVLHRLLGRLVEQGATVVLATHHEGLAGACQAVVGIPAASSPGR
jgi:excinuclease ABC subunit A